MSYIEKQVKPSLYELILHKDAGVSTNKTGQD